MTKEILLTKGKVAIVDDEDYEWLMQWKWHYSIGGYAQRNSPRINGKNHKIHMHREINHTPEDFETDHINGNKLDNRRINLRTASRSQNAFNQKINKNNTSGVRGVYWQKLNKKWQAKIYINGMNHSLGYFTDLSDAKAVYNQAAADAFGEFFHL